MVYMDLYIIICAKDKLIYYANLFHQRILTLEDNGIHSSRYIRLYKTLKKKNYMKYNNCKVRHLAKKKKLISSIQFQAIIQTLLV